MNDCCIVLASYGFSVGTRLGTLISDFHTGPKHDHSPEFLAYAPCVPAEIDIDKTTGRKAWERAKLRPPEIGDCTHATPGEPSNPPMAAGSQVSPLVTGRRYTGLIPHLFIHHVW